MRPSTSPSFSETISLPAAGPMDLLRAANIPVSRVPLLHLDRQFHPLVLEESVRNATCALTSFIAAFGRPEFMTLSWESHPTIYRMSPAITLADFSQADESLDSGRLIKYFEAFERMAWILFPHCEKDMTRFFSSALRRRDAKRLNELSSKALSHLLSELLESVRTSARGALRDEPVAQAEAFIRMLLQNWLSQTGATLPSAASLDIWAVPADVRNVPKGTARVVIGSVKSVCTVKLASSVSKVVDEGRIARELELALESVPWHRTGAAIIQLSFSVVNSVALIDSAATANEPLDGFLLSAQERSQAQIAARLSRSTSAEIGAVVSRAIHPRIAGMPTRIGSGVGGGVGLIAGRVCFSPQQVAAAKGAKEPAILCASFPDPSLMPFVTAADGFIFGRGGVTSHFAVVARGMGKPCVMAVKPNVEITTDAITIGVTRIPTGGWITVDGTDGNIYEGVAPLDAATVERTALEGFLQCCDDIAKITVLANADDADEVSEAVKAGAKGVGLCRIEHLLLRQPLMSKFFDALVELLLSKEAAAEIAALELARALWAHTDFPGQLAGRFESAKSNQRYAAFESKLGELEVGLQSSLEKLFRSACGRPVAIRLLDPPIGEFISESDVARLSAEQKVDGREAETLRKLILQSHPMLSLRGARFAIAYPELCRMQVRAAVMAAANVGRETASRQRLDLILPFVVDAAEIAVWKQVILADLPTMEPAICQLSFGAMIETPRAVLTAAAIASQVDFLAFGTNDLSQLTWASSRDDGAEFLNAPSYSWTTDRPFATFDVEGVGRLVMMAIESARESNPEIRVGVCGEHAAMPDAIPFFIAQGVQYLSCGARLVPFVRAYAAKATVERSFSR